MNQKSMNDLEVEYDSYQGVEIVFLIDRFGNDLS